MRYKLVARRMGGVTYLQKLIKFAAERVSGCPDTSFIFLKYT